ncbi:hypothetical protein F0562_020622 [Nyssa sinensis]|uniref:Uncharacterized protein n=1 Tax=Nyssa sinensis TaxID=561372 RepID=A0A5J5BVX1_9ASTE|nr:hypothetical protein F0562_020622 [Nyssa sinensis]
MLINSNAPQVPHHEEVQLGQIYFLMPISKCHLCALAIKASTALNNSAMGHAATKTAPFLAKNGVGFPAEPQGCCRILNSFDMVSKQSSRTEGKSQGETEFFNKWENRRLVGETPISMESRWNADKYKDGKKPTDHNKDRHGMVLELWVLLWWNI